MKMSRRETMQFSTAALAGLSLAGLKPEQLAAQAAPQPDGLVDTKLRQISTLPLNPDGSAVEFSAAVDAWTAAAVPVLERVAPTSRIENQSASDSSTGTRVA